MEAITAKGVSFAYPKSNKNVLNNVDFSVENGEFALIIGKSGAGKSTLLKLLKKEIAPAGRLDGELIVNGSVGYVSQNVEESIVCDRVRHELCFGLTNMGMSVDEIEVLVAETASYFNLSLKLDSEIASLSGGEKQMLNLASVMIMKPDILVLDEPTAQLDPISAERFIQMVKKLHEDFGTTIVMSQHNADEIFSYADSILLFDNAELKIKADIKAVSEYLINTNSDMLGIIPPQIRLFENATTIKECRQIIQNKALKPVFDDIKQGSVAVCLKNVCFAYTKGNDVLNELSLNVYEGKVNAIVGANASGKTTLLKTIAGVNKKYRGKIKCVSSVSMLCQNPFDLFTKEKCEDEVQFGELTAFLDIDDIKNQHPYDLSGGQAGRLALAKVLETNADIIILDEPTKAFDASLKIKLASIFKQLCEQGKTIIIASHDIEFVGEYADYVSFLSCGKIVASAKRQDFFSSLNFYTTAVSKMTNGIINGIVSVADLEKAGGLD